MDITIIIGWLLGIFLIIQGITIDKLENFWSLDSVVIVVGGTLSALIASFPARTLKQVPGHFKIVLIGKKYKPEKAIDTLVEMAKTARKNGLLALEDLANEEKDPFLKQSIMLIVDAMEAEKVREMLENEVSIMEMRHEEDVSFYERGSQAAPAFGMIGTLVGLVNMLREMNADEGGSSNIGVSMSVALITTFYGCVLAHLFFSPMAKKLRIRHEEEILYKQIIIEGALSIQAGDNPKYLEEKLLSYLAQKTQKKILKKREKSQPTEQGAPE